MLVDYSSSESENEGESKSVQPSSLNKPTFHSSTAGKIKVELPTIRAEPGVTTTTTTPDDEPRVKRARTAGAFGGINGFLPAPKRTAGTQQNALKKGVSLKTSGEAMFSRGDESAGGGYGEEKKKEGHGEEDEGEKEEKEVKLVGKATRFLPLSVSSKKRKTKEKKASVLPKTSPLEENVPPVVVTEQSEPKPKRSLFSVQQEQEEEPDLTPTSAESYQFVTTTQQSPEEALPAETLPQPLSFSSSTSSNTLSTAAEDLNLTPAQRRHLFGRNSSSSQNIPITNFSLDSEYAHNEKLRQAGEIASHRAVKAIAPGKHSLQQLVNNAKTQKDGLEDAWAEGKKNRGEGSARYGWGK